jgi:hypothetical protein
VKREALRPCAFSPQATDFWSFKIPAAFRDMAAINRLTYCNI